MLARLLVGAGLLAFGYYLGREVGRLDPVREELRRARGADAEDPTARHATSESIRARRSSE